jgi:hypothetical protein
VTSRRRKAGVVAAGIALLLVASLVLTGLILVYRPLATTDGEFRLLGLDQRGRRPARQLRRSSRLRADGARPLLSAGLRRGAGPALPDGSGQSGQPGSRYWGDQAPLWDRGEYKPMRFSKDRLGHIDGMLVFRPR